MVVLQDFESAGVQIDGVQNQPHAKAPSRKVLKISLCVLAPLREN